MIVFPFIDPNSFIVNKCLLYIQDDEGIYYTSCQQTQSTLVYGCTCMSYYIRPEGNMENFLPSECTANHKHCNDCILLPFPLSAYFKILIFLSFVILRNNWNTFVIFHHRKKKLRVNNNCQASGQLRLWSTTASYILYS